MRGSTSSVRSDFDAFLFAPISEGNNDNGMQLSILSALARQTARLARVPREAGTDRRSRTALSGVRTADLGNRGTL